MYVLAGLIAVMFAAVSGVPMASESENEESAEVAEIGHRLVQIAGLLIAVVGLLGRG